MQRATNLKYEWLTVLYTPEKSEDNKAIFFILFYFFGECSGISSPFPLTSFPRKTMRCAVLFCKFPTPVAFCIDFGFGFRDVAVAAAFHFLVFFFSKCTRGFLLFHDVITPRKSHFLHRSTPKVTDITHVQENQHLQHSNHKAKDDFNCHAVCWMEINWSTS